MMKSFSCLINSLALLLATASHPVSGGGSHSDLLHPFSLLSRRSVYDPATFGSHAMHNPQVWIDMFRKDTASFAARAAEIDPKRSADFSGAFSRILSELSLQGGPGLNCVALCRLREECLRAAGFEDIFESVKREENAAALRLLPSVLAYLDDEDVRWVAEDPRRRRRDAASAERARERLRRALCGVLAGNIFDLGAAASIERFEKAKAGAGSGGAESGNAESDAPPAGFVATSEWVRNRPLAVDHVGEFLDRALPLPQKGLLEYRKVLIFVDNCGADLVCGVLPFVRDLFLAADGGAGGGLEVVLCANERPSINDVTAEELQKILQSLVVSASASASSEEASESYSQSSESSEPSEGLALLASCVESGRLRVVSTGNDMPVIDLRRVSRALDDEALAGCDLCVFEGMGRGIETNLRTTLAVDSLNLGMVKHHEVAHLLGGSLYDSVCAFKKGTGEDVHDTETGPVAKLPWRRMIGDWREPHDF